MTLKNNHWGRRHGALAALLAIGVFSLWMILRDDRSGDMPTRGSDEPTAAVPVVEPRQTVLKTNSWFSSVYKKFPTAPMFVLPGTYRFDEAGLSFGMPSVAVTENTVFGGFDPLCSAGPQSATTEVGIERYGDWDATFSVQSGSAPWKAHLSQGSPVVTIDELEGMFTLSCAPGVEITSIDRGVMVKRGASAVIIQGKGSAVSADWESGSSKALILSSERSYRIVVLPQEMNKPASFFIDFPWTDIADTHVEYRRSNGNIIADHSFVSTDGDAVLTTLWPHHLSGMGSGTPESIGTYRTSTGDLRLIRTKSFSVTYDDPKLAFTFNQVRDKSAQELIREKIREDASVLSGETPPAGVYFRGTWLGGLASVAQLAALYGMEEEEHKLLDMLEKELLSSLENFTYDEKSFVLVAENDEFGNKEGNDHHFHYGYYLRSAAVLVSLRPDLRSRIEPTMNELALDIANTDRSNPRFPYLRNFAPYDGHSWADGFALFNDGNNQESTSEALNAWYGVWMWGEVTGQESLKNIGPALFATELAGTKAYWFGENNPFPTGYTHTMASLVWGGKRDYATWFSADPMHIHGIQWLPITPASSYLRGLPRHEDRVREVSVSGADPLRHEWADLYLAYRSYAEPGYAASMIGRIPETSRAIKSRALLYQSVYGNVENRK